jgi:hypothetical protein
MKINVVPTPGASASTSQQSTPQQDARARAIAALSSSNSPPGGEALPTVNSQVAQNALETQTIEQTDNTEEVTSPIKEEPISTQYAVLARKEKALRAKVVAQEQQWKQREAQLTARETELQSKNTIDTSKYISIDDLKRDAFGVLTKNGVSYDDISQQALAAQSPESQYYQRMREEMNQELQKVREEQANTRKSYEQQQSQAYQQAVTQIRNEANQLVKTDPNFETVRETGSVNDVVDLIERTFKEDGILMTVEEAAQAVEDHLIEEAMKISKIKKIQERLKSAAQKAPAAQQQASQAQQQPNQMKTLTNTVGSSKPMSARERALLAFKNELK